MEYYLTESLSQEEVDKIYSNEEYWVPIKGYEDLYEISSLARVKSLARFVKRPQGGYNIPERIMKQRIMSTGYISVGLSIPGKQPSAKLLHRLYAEAFIPNPKNLPCVNHKDGDKLNNDLSNLEWCSYAVNNAHAVSHNLRTVAQGEDVNSSKLTNREAHEIRRMYTYENVSILDLALEYGVSKETIRCVINGDTYKQDDEILIVDARNKIKNKLASKQTCLPYDKVVKIRQYMQQHEFKDIKSVLDKFCISLNQYYKIKNNRNYGKPRVRRNWWLSKGVVQKIRNMLSVGINHSEIANKLHVSRRQVDKISQGQTYVDVKGY